jgi:hypothetical protein
MTFIIKCLCFFRQFQIKIPSQTQDFKVLIYSFSLFHHFHGAHIPTFKKTLTATNATRSTKPKLKSAYSVDTQQLWWWAFKHATTLHPILHSLLPHRPHKIPPLYGKHEVFPQRSQNMNTTAQDHVRDTTRTTNKRKNSSNEPSLETSHLLRSYKQNTSKVTSFDLSLSSVFFSETHS